MSLFSAVTIRLIIVSFCDPDALCYRLLASGGNKKDDIICKREQNLEGTELFDPKSFRPSTKRAVQSQLCSEPYLHTDRIPTYQAKCCIVDALVYTASMDVRKRADSEKADALRKELLLNSFTICLSSASSTGKSLREEELP